MLDTSTQTRTETAAPVTHKIAIVIYSNVTTEAKSRAYRAFGFAAELMAAGDDVTIVFDGGGSATLAAVIDPKHGSAPGLEPGRSIPSRGLQLLRQGLTACRTR